MTSVGTATGVILAVALGFFLCRLYHKADQQSHRRTLRVGFSDGLRLRADFRDESIPRLRRLRIRSFSPGGVLFPRGTVGIDQAKCGSRRSAFQIGGIDLSASEGLPQIAAERPTIASRKQAKRAYRRLRLQRTATTSRFRINLLALNAAVEAARAGEAGGRLCGSLPTKCAIWALRSAEAARNTDAIIGDTPGEYRKRALPSSARALEEFYNMGELGKTTFELIKQVGETTKEQAAGIEHINKAISENRQGGAANRCQMRKSPPALRKR